MTTDSDEKKKLPLPTGPRIIIVTDKQIKEMEEQEKAREEILDEKNKIH